MFTVNFYATCFVSRGNSIGKKFIRFDREKAACQSLFTLANTMTKSCYYVSQAVHLSTSYPGLINGQVFQKQMNYQESVLT